MQALSQKEIDSRKHRHADSVEILFCNPLQPGSIVTALDVQLHSTATAVHIQILQRTTRSLILLELPALPADRVETITSLFQHPARLRATLLRHHKIQIELVSQFRPRHRNRTE